MYSSPSQWPLVTGTLLIVSAASCQPAQESPDGPRQWALIEELSIGSLDGLNGEPTFGMLSEVVGTSDGGAIVVDVQVPAVFRFGAGGELLHQLGRRGDGPGEYRDVSGVAVMGDGRVLVRDSRRALMFFDADGHLASEWPVRVDLIGSDPVAVIDGGVLLRTIARRSSLEAFWEAPTYDFVHVQYPGVVADTLTPLPSYRHAGLYRAPFHPTYHLAWLSDGSLVHGAGSEYRIEILGPSGDTLAHPEPPSDSRQYPLFYSVQT